MRSDPAAVTDWLDFIRAEEGAEPFVIPSRLEPSRNLLLFTMKNHDWPFAFVAVIAGGLIGYAQLRLSELAISAVLVAIVTMFLGAVRPRRPWLWALLVALCVPVVQFIAYLEREHFTRGATASSFALLAPAFVCAYGGAVGRKLLRELFAKPT